MCSLNPWTRIFIKKPTPYLTRDPGGLFGRSDYSSLDKVSRLEKRSIWREGKLCMERQRWTFPNVEAGGDLMQAELRAELGELGAA